MSKHTDQTRVHNNQLVIFAVESQFAEPILDDDMVQFGYKIKRNDDAKKLGEPEFLFKHANEADMINAYDLKNGIFVVASLKPALLQRAIVAGVTWLYQTGQLGCDAYSDTNGHEDTDAKD